MRVKAEDVTDYLYGLAHNPLPHGWNLRDGRGRHRSDEAPRGVALRKVSGPPQPASSVDTIQLSHGPDTARGDPSREASNRPNWRGNSSLWEMVVELAAKLGYGVEQAMGSASSYSDEHRLQMRSRRGKIWYQSCCAVAIPTRTCE